MIFNTITLKNFRQYKGDNTFEFPVSDNKKITLIIAPNGVGKTTFSQAVRFCFYGESPNVLRLPRPEDNLNYSVIEDLRGGEEADLSVRVGFSHNGTKYLAARTVKFVKESYATKPVKRLESKFELWEDSEVKGLIKVDDGEKRINEMMPIGLAHVYMFDGERVEKPIGSPEFKKSLKESVIGVLGLNKLEQAQVFLGDKSKRTSIIGRVASQIKAQTATEQDVLRTKDIAERGIAEGRKAKAENEHLIEKMTQHIEEAKKAQAGVEILKGVVKDRQLVENKVSRQQGVIAEMVKLSNDVAARLVYKLELAKTYPKYLKFVNSEGEQPEVFENLYESVIQDILKRGICICGRPVSEGGHEADILRSLAVLPHDNAHYLNSLKSLYASLDDMPDLLEKVRSYRERIGKAQIELEKYRKELDRANEAVKKAEAEAGTDNQTNIDVLMGHRATYNLKLRAAEEKIKANEATLSGIKGQLNKISASAENNIKVTKAVRMLELLKLSIDEELERKKEIAKQSIETNMNKTLRNVMTQRYAVELDDDYNMTVWKQLDNEGNGQDETEVLSTGQNVVIYLSFLRALLMTVEEHSEFSDVQSSGVIMDAALSNLDEEHIQQISQKILGSFDELIFLSYKAQLRNELIAGVKDKVAKVYELSKDDRGNIVVSTRDANTIEEYVNAGEDDDE